MSLRVRCIRKLPDHHDPHHRIRFVGGEGWEKSVDQVLFDLDHGLNSYHVRVGDLEVAVIAATHSGRRYVKTRADDDTPDNLLSLPECS